ncbi:MAG: SH3 domain-containing protein [Lachnospiraceae bacterium]|nr:SH3 domain-containing protein [bacterium]MDY5517235.1 SH3 domain-containing protein [Lachnospiraceae bacterium]
MANKNRKNQNKSSADHIMTNEKENHTENKQPKDGVDFTVLWELVKRYKRYIAAGALFVAMVVVLAKCTGPVTEAPKEPVSEEQPSDAAEQAEEFQVDAIPEVNELINNYYTAYAAGDVAALEKIAQPISDTEKSYIQVFSEYVDSYDNLSCHTKSGLNNGEYVVSVYLEMKFKDVKTVAPGLDFFYLRTDESGKLYIDNAYSQFNQSNMEESTQADVQALINEFEQAEDVVALQAEVQQKYEQAIAADPQLEQMANETIPNAISTWVQSLTQADQTDEQDKPADDETAQNEQTGEEASGEEQPEEEKPEDDKSEDKEENSDGKAKTAYAMDGINLRKGPSTEKAVVTQILLGDKLKIYPDTEKDGWVKAVYNGKKGYVKRELVTTKRSKVPTGSETADDEPAKTLPEGKKITLSDSVNVRVSMSETADRVGLAYQGDTVTVIQSYAEGWTKVEWNGQTGYIKTELIK